MSDHIFSTAMPHPLHPNCYLDVLFTEKKGENDKGSSFHLSSWFDTWLSKHIDSLLDEILNRIKNNGTLLPCPVREEECIKIKPKKCLALTNALVDKIRITSKKPVFKGVSESFVNFDKDIVIWQRPFRIERHSTTGELVDAAILDRNHTFLLNRIHKLENKGFAGVLDYKQTKRAVSMTLYSLLESQELVHRKGDFETPSGFKFKNKSLLVVEAIKRIISSSEDSDDDIDFPLLKAWVRVAENEKKYDYPLAIGIDGRGAKATFAHKFEIGRTSPRKEFKDGITDDEFESLQSLDPVDGWEEWRASGLLKQNKFAYHQMMTQPCSECEVGKGTPCHINNLGIPFDKTITYGNGISVPRIKVKDGDAVKYSIESIRSFLRHYYTYANAFREEYDGEGKLYAGRLWKETWPVELREHALESINRSDGVVLPFSCPKRHNYKFYDSSLGDILVSALYPLTLRKNKREPNKGTIKRYFGGKNPPAMTVQNLWIDLFKRILSNYSKNQKNADRLGRKGRDDYCPLLFEILDDELIRTVEIDNAYAEKNASLTTIPFVKISGGCLSKTSDKKGHWTWHDMKDWENNKGKLPIVSMNTSTAEIKQIFDNKEFKGLPGLVLSIDQWSIKGDDDEAYEPSPLDQHYNINPDRFHKNERSGARTFATFVKRIIDMSKYSIARADVNHTRRAYGVLLRSDFEGNKE